LKSILLLFFGLQKNVCAMIISLRRLCDHKVNNRRIDHQSTQTLRPQSFTMTLTKKTTRHYTWPTSIHVSLTENAVRALPAKGLLHVIQSQGKNSLSQIEAAFL
jgi:hypothetical protein